MTGQPCLGDLHQRQNKSVLILDPWDPEGGPGHQIAQQIESNQFHALFCEEFHHRDAHLYRATERTQRLSQAFAQFSIRKDSSGLVHPGTSIWAERADLVNMAQNFGLTLIGPSAKNLALFDHRLQLILLAEKCGIPNLILDSTPLHTRREIETRIREMNLSFPFVLKTARGNSHLGLLAALNPQTLIENYPLWIEQIRNQWGEATFYLEKYVEGARLITVPFARFQNGSTYFFPMVDASLQSKNRKIVEFCPATQIDFSVRVLLKKWTRQLTEACRYVGVGALEYLVDGPQAYFIGGIPRLNTQFHLWEKVAGTKAVSWQLATLIQDSEEPFLFDRNIPRWPKAVSFRIYSENFLFQLPQIGNLHEVQKQRKWQNEENEAELHLFYRKNQKIELDHDGILAQLSVFGQTQKLNLNFASKLLNQLWIFGEIQTNEQQLLEIANHPWIREGIFHASFIDEDFLPSLEPSSLLLKQSLAPFFRFLSEQTGQEIPHIYWSLGGPWIKAQLVSTPPLPPAVWIEGPHFWQHHGQRGFSGVITDKQGNPVFVGAYPRFDEWNVKLGAWYFNVKMFRKTDHELTARLTGKVYAVLFRKGAIIPAHEPIVIIYAQGVLIPHSLPKPARLTLIRVRAEEGVTSGQKLANYEWVEESSVNSASVLPSKAQASKQVRF